MRHGRIHDVGKPIPTASKKGLAPHEETIKLQYANVSKDLQGLNSFRYQRQISGGNQELIEALTFHHYLETQQLLSYQDAAARLAEISGPDFTVMLGPDDYLLGIYDMVGELMRHAITAMATGAFAVADHESIMPRTVLTDMRELRSCLEKLELDEGSFLARDVGKKMPVMKQCVEKVENAMYGLIVRGSERPKGWMPDAETTVRGEVEGY